MLVVRAKAINNATNRFINKMQKQQRLAALLLASLATLPLGACASWMGTDKPPAEVVEFAKRVPEVQNSRTSECWQQAQIAKQQAFLESTIQGKEVIRHTACGDKESVKPEGKTS